MEPWYMPISSPFSFKILVGMCLVGAALAPSAQAQVYYSEDFDSVLPAGWTSTNISTTIGTSPNWFQGNPTVFNAQAGATNSYAGANFNATTGAGTINLWLITSSLTVNNGDTVSFFTRTVDTPAFPDRLELRFNPLNDTNVGATATSVGNFTTLLTTVNPTLTTSGYPNTWTQFSTTFSGLGGPTTGRLAFRYFVTNGGPSGANSDFIGVDTLRVSAPVSAPEPTTLALLSLSLPIALRLRRRK